MTSRKEHKVKTTKASGGIKTTEVLKTKKNSN
jgi:hypothetical protein